MNINKKRSYENDPDVNPIVELKKARIQFQRIFSVQSKDPNQPCDECGTVLSDWINKKVMDIPKAVKKDLFICSHCCQYLAGPPAGIRIGPKVIKVTRPQGWHLLRCYVDAEGNYFEFGKEKPELKGTVAPTFKPKPAADAVPKPVVKKLMKKQKVKIQHSAAAILFDLKRINPDKYDKKNKKKFDAYLSIITEIAYGNKFPKNYQTILDQYEKEIKKL